jgi:hypothetical protein
MDNLKLTEGKDINFLASGEAKRNRKRARIQILTGLLLIIIYCIIIWYPRH